MAFEIEYFHERVLSEIESWPVDVLADYARLVELLIEHGPSLRLLHSRAFGDGLFEFGLVAGRALVVLFTASCLASVLLCCMHSSRRLNKHQTMN